MLEHVCLGHTWRWWRLNLGALLCLLLGLLACPATAEVREAHAIELNIDTGAIRGEYLTIGADAFTVFKGIPYAAPPVGALRFQVL